MTPEPPVLFIRPKLAFWIESQWNDSFLATLQALREGCYEKTRCLDNAGRNWSIIAADLLTPASFLDKLLPWRKLPVALTLGVPTRAVLDDEVEALCEILSHPDTDFPFALASPPVAIQAKFKSAQSIPELISIAKASCRGAA
jgi:hypothetical protein